MSATVGPGDIRELLRDFKEIDSVKDSWIQDRISKRIIPDIEHRTGLTLGTEKEVIEFHSGTNESVLMLDTINAIELVRVEILDTVATTQDQKFILVADEGFIKSQNSDEFLNTPAFPKGARNIRVTLKIGFATLPEDLKEAVAAMAAEAVLGHLQGQDGGGTSLSVVSYSKSYGERGKYTEARQNLLHIAYTILRRYTTAVVGQGGHE